MDILRSELLKLFSFLNNDSLAHTFTVISMIIIWLVIGFIFGMLSKFFVNRIPRIRKHNAPKHAETLLNMLSKVFSSLFWFFILIMILDELKINFLPVLASAGIVAFAVGFGAQELIKDLISGFFLILENAFDVGDIIEIGTFRGKVTQIGLRRTRLTNWKNEVLVVNNGDIKSLINFSSGNSVAVAEITVSYQTDISLFSSPVLTENFSKLKFDYPQIIEDPTFIGVSNLKDSGIVLRFTCKTQNYQHIPVERALRNVIATYCVENEIQTAKLILTNE